MCGCCIFFFKQKTAYEMRISDWSSDVCSSDLLKRAQAAPGQFTLTDIVGRVVHKTRSSVLAIVSIRLVASYANPPAVVMQAIQFVFTIAVVLQVAIWAREIVIGMIQRSAAARHHEQPIHATGNHRFPKSDAPFQ